MAINLEKIQTERLLLRGIRGSDAIKILELRSNPNVYIFFKCPHKINIFEHLAWYFTNYLLDKNRLDWMCIEKESKKKIGIVGLNLSSDTAEISYIISPNSQHKGYAIEAINGLITYAHDIKHIRKITAEINKDNYASIGLVRKLGFSCESSASNFIIFSKVLDD